MSRGDPWKLLIFASPSVAVVERRLWEIEKPLLMKPPPAA
jgi:hypothetical protein